MLAQPPDVGLLTSQTGAVDAALLTSTDTDGLTVLHVAYRVRLCVLQGDEGNNQVATCLFGECLVSRGYVLEERGVVQLYLVASLLEGDAKDLLAFDGRGLVRRVNLDDVVGALAFLAQNLQGFLCVAGRNDAVAHFALDDEGRCLVAGVAQGDEVAVAAHAVGSAGTGIGTGNWAEGNLYVVHEVNLRKRVAQRQTHGSAGRRDVLEACGCGQTRCSLQLLDELPTVQGVEEVDVTRASAEHFDGQFFSVLHVDARGFLVGVATIFQL